MKRYILFILLLVAMAAQAQTRYVGYTTTDDIDVEGAYFGHADTYTIGAMMTPEQLSPYEGCRVVGLRLASALDLGRTRTFVYTLGESSATPVIEQRQRIYTGWNQVLFNGEGHLIQAGETLFFGFDYTETDEMVANEQGALCGVGTDVDGGCYYYGPYQGGYAFFAISGIGRLCVQLIVDVSSLPQYDIDMTYLDTGFKYKKPGETIEGLTSFANVGRENVSSFQLGYQLDDKQPFFLSVDSTLREGRSDSWLFECPLPADCPVGLHTLQVFVSQVNGQALHDKSKNDTLTASFAVYNESLQRSKAYFEVYTDQNSPYVPFLNDAVNLLTGSMSDKLAVVNIHRPGTTLAIDEAAYLHELYAYDWPTFTMNRSYFPGEPYIAYDMNDYLPVIGAEMSAGIIGDMAMQDYCSPSFASLDLQGTYDPATRRLTLQATGRLLPEAEAIYGNLALTLMLAEDGVKARQMVYNSRTGRSSIDNNYTHNQVLRTFLTAPAGDMIVPSDNENYTSTHKFTIPDDWNAEKLTLVALLTKHVDTVTDDNVRDVDVINAQTLPLGTLPAPSIVSHPSCTDNDSQPAFFTLDGKPIDGSHLRPGIYIERKANGTTRVVSSRAARQ